VTSGTPGLPPLADWRPESFSLAGQTALVIGGNSGIGKEMARGLLRAGARLVVAGRNEAKLGAAVSELGAAGPVTGVQADVSRLDALRALVHHAIATLGHIDILINAQGILRLQPAEAFTEDDYAAVMDTNLKSVFFACTEVGRHMLARGSGSIINIASLAAYRGWQNSSIYAMGKAGIVALTETLAIEWAKRGVRVNGITPGFFLTDLNRERMNDARKARAVDRTPAGRFGELPELVGAAVFLASPAARFITGETLRVDGGFLAAGI
jgi:NAD(P)-dependent dehydrogenase (short-subunit alcohol dehydrogenase family)